MRIGSADTFLLMEVTPLEGGYNALRLEAVASALGQKFTVVHDRLRMGSGEQAIQHLGEFADLKRDQFETAFTEGGWLRFQRNSHGAIIVRYRIGGRNAAAMEGEVLVDGEFANSFCREFGSLLRSQR
jgi:hypothetical protein